MLGGFGLGGVVESWDTLVRFVILAECNVAGDPWPLALDRDPLAGRTLQDTCPTSFQAGPSSLQPHGSALD